VLLLVVGGVAAGVLLAGLLLRWSAALALGIWLLGAPQATPLTAGALLLVAELAWWSIEPRIPAWAPPSVAVWRTVRVLLICIAATVVSAVVVVAAGAPVGGGTPLLLTGIVAATAAVGVLAFVARGESVVD
jgi:hypothetical protein